MFAYDMETLNLSDKKEIYYTLECSGLFPEQQKGQRKDRVINYI